MDNILAKFAFSKWQKKR